MLLILADQFDVHADLVEQHLEKKGVKLFRLNLDVASLQQVGATFDGKDWIMESPHGDIKSDRVSCVWSRRSFVETSLEESDSQDIDFKIWRGEWNKTLLGFYSSVNSATWLNPLRENSRTENKYHQMRIAKSVGLRMPTTITSNKKEVLKRFCEEHEEVVLKLMHQDFYRMNDGSIRAIYVNKVSAEMIEQFEGTTENPIVLQRYIPKLFEVRYTVVGDYHHVCKIESQASEIANTDWRRYDIPNTPHYSIDPPDDIKVKVSELMKQFSIPFGALDFVVSPEGEWYFLEVNPSGQWLWIEDLTGMPISHTIALWLDDKTRKDIQ